MIIPELNEGNFSFFHGTDRMSYNYNSNLQFVVMS